MPTPPFFISVAQLGAELAIGAADPRAVIARNLDYVTMALEALARERGPQIVVLPKGVLQGLAPAGVDAAACRAAALRMDGPEVAALGRTAARLGCYVAGGVYEGSDSGAVSSSGFVLDPEGRVALACPQRVAETFDSTAPLAAADGSTDAFPVLETPYGTLGILVGPDVNTFEISKSLVYRGAEILLHPAAPPPDWLRRGWTQARRARAYQGLAVVASATPGLRPGVTPFPGPSHGDSTVIDWTGRVLVDADGNLETAATARIDLGALRAQRQAVGMNFPVQTRTTMFAAAFTALGNRPS